MIYAKRNQVVIPREMPRPRNAPWISSYPNEQWLEDRIGKADMLAAYKTSMELHIPMPIMGTGAFMFQGAIHPAVAGGAGRKSLTSVMQRVADHITMAALLPLTAGFASLSDLISEMTVGGKGQYIQFSKVGVAGTINCGSTVWYQGVIPGVGATPAALAAGTLCSDVTVGAIGPSVIPAGGDTLHIIGAEGNINVVSMGFLLYDRIWMGEIAATTTGAQTCTFTPGRYAGTAADGSGTSTGNVVFLECRIAPGAAAPTITLSYKDEKNNTAENAATLAGISSAVIKTIPYLGQLFFTLAAGDRGVSAIASIGLSTSWLTTPSVEIVMAHPLMYIPGLSVANAGYIRDGVNSAFNLQRVYDNACLAILETLKPATTATTYTGALTLCAG